MNTPPNPRHDLTLCQALTDVPEDALPILLERCRSRTFASGEVLIRQGDPGDSLFIIVDGSASAIVRDSEGEGRRVGRFGGYDIIGEMALLTGEPRTADVITESAGEALELSVADFQELVGKYPDFAIVLTHMIAERLGENSADGMGGKLVGDYRIKRCVGRGGMAIVYEAHSEVSHERVALKMMSHRLIYRKGGLARFQREADILSSLAHENITRVYSRFSAYRTCFIVMEFCDGCDLFELVRRGYQPDEKDLRRIMGQLAAGLAYLHSRDVIHRDLKPQNILVSRSGELKLTDFGLARSFGEMPDESITIPGTILGTPAYMAPEQITGTDANSQSDIYSFGCVLLYALTGVTPFAGCNLFDVADQKRNFTLQPRRKLGSGVSRKVYKQIKSCLLPSPELRKIDLQALSQWSEPISIPSSFFDEPAQE